MDIHIDLGRTARHAARSDSTLTNGVKIKPELIVRDSNYLVRLYLYDENGALTTIATGQVLALAGKAESDYSSDTSANLFYTDAFTLVGTAYEAELNLNTTEFIAAMEGNKTIQIKIEVELQGPTAGDITTIVQTDGVGVKDVNRGDEGPSVDAGPTNLTTTAAAQLYMPQSTGTVGQLILGTQIFS